MTTSNLIGPVQSLRRFYTSEQVASWTPNWTVNSCGINTTWNSISWSPELGRFCAISNGINVMISSDGINWI